LYRVCYAEACNELAVPMLR